MVYYKDFSSNKNWCQDRVKEPFKAIKENKAEGDTGSSSRGKVFSYLCKIKIMGDGCKGEEGHRVSSQVSQNQVFNSKVNGQDCSEDDRWR